ncbi:MAG TPA: hypothetical protein VGX50_11820 [Longimicrobium sp.]|jgi:hypothetical protein|nr:hypothetical protein [Longimicrobium sp.]
MRRSIRRTRALLVSLAITGVLGFGASAALANVAPPCPRLAIGSCTTLAQCQEQCAQVGGDASGARCEADGGTGCCHCPLVL